MTGPGALIRLALYVTALSAIYLALIGAIVIAIGLYAVLNILKGIPERWSRYELYFEKVASV